MSGRAIHPRVAAAQAALEAARRALYEAGRTGDRECLHTALRRAPFRARAEFLQARDHMRQITCKLGVG